MFVAAEETLEALRAQEAALREMCAGLDPEAVPVPAVVGVFECLARMERLVAGAKVRMARRVEASRAWERSGDRDAAEFVAKRDGTSIGRARDALATSSRLLGQPAVEEAVAAGVLSGAQLEVIADAGVVNPAAVAGLVGQAGEVSLGELRGACARAKAAADPDPEATHRRIHAGRHLRRGTDLEGAFTISGRGTVDAGAQLKAALDPIIDELAGRAHRAGVHEGRDAYAFDALVELARRATGTPTEPGAPTRRVPVRHLALVRVDLDALVRGKIDGEETCELAGLGPVPVRVARDLLGESILHLVLTRGTDVAGVVHLGRGPNAAQRIALLWSQPGCSVQGCPRTAGIQHDHRTPWADHPETRLANLDRLCAHHHDHKTYNGWALTTGTGKRPMVPPDDPRHPTNQTPRAGPAPPPEETTVAAEQPNLFATIAG